MLISLGNHREQNIINSIKFLGNGGIFHNSLSSIKRLVTSRPTLKQYILQSRIENYHSTVRPHRVPNSSKSPCASGSTECILRHLRNRGLIRNTSNAPHRKPKQIKVDNSQYSNGWGSSHAQGNVQLQRGRGHYRPDCWSDDDKNDQAPAIDYAEYSDVDNSKTVTTSQNNRRKQILIRANRRNADSIGDPCLWQEDWQG